MNTINIIRGVVKTTSGIGAAAIVQNACKAFTPNEVHIAIKALYGIGAFGIGCAVVEATDAYWDKLFDELDNIINKYEVTDEPEVEEMKKELQKLQKKVEKEIKKEAKKESKKSSKKKNEPIEVEFEEIEE